MKVLLFGVGGALLASVLWITVTLVLPVWGPYMIGRFTGTGGASTGYVGSDSILIAALIGFVIASALAWVRFKAA